MGDQASRCLSAAATGWDTGAFAANVGTTFIQSSFTFDFSVVGPPSGIPVTLIIGGTRDGLVTNTGDPNRWISTVGTRLSITSLGGVFNCATRGPQSGTAPDVFAGTLVMDPGIGVSPVPAPGTAAMLRASRQTGAVRAPGIIRSSLGSSRSSPRRG